MCQTVLTSPNDFTNVFNERILSQEVLTTESSATPVSPLHSLHSKDSFIANHNFSAQSGILKSVDINQQKGGLKVMQANVDTLTNKMEELQLRIVTERPDIICLQEVLPKFSLDEIQTDITFKIDGYTMYCADNMKRGTIIYVIDKLPSTQIECTDVPDICACYVSLSANKTLYICNVYRSPNSDSSNDDSILAYLTVLARGKQDNLLICGDFNLKDIDWSSQHGRSTASENLIHFIQDNFLTQHVSEHTRFREGQQDSLLDLIITDTPDRITDISFTAPLGKSDHVCLVYYIDGSYDSQSHSKESKNYYRGNYVQITEDIAAIDWEDKLNDMDVNDSWDLFCSVISTSVNQNIPNSRATPRNRQKWMTKDTDQAIKDKHRAYNKYRKNKTEINLESYKKAKNHATQTARNARVNFETRIANNVKDNPKEFWAYIKHQTSSAKGLAPLLKEDGSLALDAQDKAELLNDFFASVFTSEDTDNIPVPDPRQVESFLTDIKFTEENILQVIKDMKSGSSAGPDEIHPRVIKETSQAIVTPLCIIFNKSIEEGQIPRAWKDAIIVPIFKKGKRSSPGNYRPVSLTSVCCKLMERIVRKSIHDHINVNKLFASQQHGFRSGRSCNTQLLTVTETWTQWHDSHTPFDCVYLDYRKAFDSVPHARLLSKVNALGIKGKVYEWIEAFLSERRQRVRVEGSLSGWERVTSGIPQGSCLGPTLFLIFIDDLPGTVDSPTSLFADDTKVYRQVDSEPDRLQLQADLDALDAWSKKWQLPFNESKCKVIHYGSNNPKANFTLGGKTISEDSQESDLGVLFDPSLSFSAHHVRTTAKANSRLGLIKRSFRNPEPKTFVQLYKALVRPTIEYCSTVTNPVHKKDQDKIERVQRRATKLVQGLEDHTYDDRLKELRLDSLSVRRSRADLLQTYRIIHKVDNIEEDLFFQRAPSNRTRNNGFKLFKHHCSTKVRGHSFSQRTIDQWNELPASVVAAPSLNHFKSGLRKFRRQSSLGTQPPVTNQAHILLVEREDHQA